MPAAILVERATAWPEPLLMTESRDALLCVSTCVSSGQVLSVLKSPFDPARQESQLTPMHLVSRRGFSTLPRSHRPVQQPLHCSEMDCLQPRCPKDIARTTKEQLHLAA